MQRLQSMVFFALAMHIMNGNPTDTTLPTDTSQPTFSDSTESPPVLPPFVPPSSSTTENTINGCELCEEDQDCLPNGTGFECVAKTNCTEHQDCFNEAIRFCKDGICVACTSDKDCEPSYCTSKGKCEMNVNQNNEKFCLENPSHWFCEINGGNDALLYEDMENSRRRKRSVLYGKMMDKIYQWENGVVPYEFDMSMSAWDTMKTKIEPMIKQFNEEVGKCINIRPKENGDKYFANITRRKYCGAYVGNKMRQDEAKSKKLTPSIVFLGVGCMTKGNIHHLLMHLLGFVHTHQRNDRNQYVTVNISNCNLEEKRCGQLFKIGNTETQGFPYEYGSIMHFKEKDFVKPGTVILKKVDEKNNEEMGNINGITEIDKLMIRKFYGCDPCGNKCPKGTYCSTDHWDVDIERKCVACRNDSHCKPHEYCNCKGECISRGDCGEGSPCGKNQFCNGKNKCVENYCDNICGELGMKCNKKKGDFGECEPACTTDQNCEENKFCNTAGKCVDKCLKDCECQDNKFCNELGKCVKNCERDFECPVNEFCNAAGKCAENCCGDHECRKGKMCNAEGKCVESQCDSICATAGRTCDKKLGLYGECIPDYCEDICSKSGMRCDKTKGFGKFGKCIPECDADHPCCGGKFCTSHGKCVENCKVDCDCGEGSFCNEDGKCLKSEGPCSDNKLKTIGEKTIRKEEWGEFVDASYCPINHFAIGYRIKIQKPCTNCDSLGMTGLELICKAKGDCKKTTIIRNKYTPFNDTEWKEIKLCPGKDNPLVKFKLLLLEYQGNSKYTDIGVYNVKFQCKDKVELITEGIEKPTIGKTVTSAYSCPPGKAIVGFASRIFRWDPNSDNTAFGGMKIICGEF